MYLTLEAVEAAMRRLGSLHPFFGFTFLVAKAQRLPVGKASSIGINALEQQFLDRFFKPDPRSKHPYQLFKPGKGERRWLSPRYASTGLQSVRTRGHFAQSFLHKPGTDLWGWKPDYIDILRPLLHGEPIPAFALAVWLYREVEWSSKAEPASVVERFYKDFHISAAEKRALFDTTVPQSSKGMFAASPVTWSDLRQITGSPPDALPEEGGTLTFLQTEGIGPAQKMVFEPGARLNLIVGDNGLGKTFLLDCAWWALTGEWASLPAYPRPDTRPGNARIQFDIASSQSRPVRRKAEYDWKNHRWPVAGKRPTIPGLIVYARVDGSFAVWDPLRMSRPSFAADPATAQSLVLSRDHVWQGQEGITEGLVRDWVRWQSNRAKHPFDTFAAVLKRLSPADLGPLTPGEPVRVPGYPQEFPTLRHPYGDVPIIFASAGVRRIVTLAYLIVWAWNEHKVSSTLQHRPPQKHMVVIVDEMEAHLHPQWQRIVLPSLLGLREDLSPDLATQLIVATHAPLVMASVEPWFSEETDKLFHLGMLRDGTVRLDELPYVPYGPVDSWLMSDVFQLKQPRSREAESAIEMAKSLQMRATVTTRQVEAANDQLSQHLQPEDEFWPRWVLFAERHGVKL